MRGWVGVLAGAPTITAGRVITTPPLLGLPVREAPGGLERGGVGVRARPLGESCGTGATGDVLGVPGRAPSGPDGGFA
jgi:hypothetical protein